MNSKPTVLVSENKTVFQTWFLDEIWQQYFNVEIIDPNKNYDVRSTVVVSDWVDFSNQQNVNERTLAQSGIRHVIDKCWDSWDSVFDNSADFTLRPIDFMWINESLWYTSLGYHKLELTSNPSRDFLLLMHLKKPWRTKLYNRLSPVLSANVYSYVGDDVVLQNAKDIPYNTENWQRYTDPTWYTDTRFSVVSEANVVAPDPLDLINVTEKTLKTCAFKHACIIWGHAGTLAWQRRQGFETFEHCIDEGYDSVLDEEVRLDGVIEQIHLCINDKTIFTDPLTKQKLEHNYNHFYNQEIIMKLMHEQIIDPLLEFINA